MYGWAKFGQVKTLGDGSDLALIKSFQVKITSRMYRRWECGNRPVRAACDGGGTADWGG